MVSDPALIKTLSDAIAELGSIQAAILALSRRDDDRWRHDLIALRRRLQQQIACLRPLLDAADGAPGDIDRLRSAFGRMRSTVALHQANWPAVAIARNDPDYQASVGEVRAANNDFIRAVMALVPRNQA